MATLPQILSTLNPSRKIETAVNGKDVTIVIDFENNFTITCGDKKEWEGMGFGYPFGKNTMQNLLRLVDYPFDKKATVVDLHSVFRTVWGPAFRQVDAIMNIDQLARFYGTMKAYNIMAPFTIQETRAYWDTLDNNVKRKWLRRAETMKLRFISNL